MRTRTSPPGYGTEAFRTCIERVSTVQTVFCFACLLMLACNFKVVLSDGFTSRFVFVLRGGCVSGLCYACLLPWFAVSFEMVCVISDAYYVENYTNKTFHFHLFFKMSQLRFTHQKIFVPGFPRKLVITKFHTINFLSRTSDFV